MSTYAYLCPKCRHLVTEHGLVDGGHLPAGPFRCACGCEIAQNESVIHLTETEYREHVASRMTTIRPTETRL